MIADPPAIILATTIGLDFLDFYWFQDKISLGTLSVIGLLAALLTLAWQFRKLNDRIDIIPEKLQVSYTPLIFFIISVLVLAVVPWHRLEGWNHPGLVGLGLGLIVLVFGGGRKREMLRKFDWQTILFLIGIFIVIGTVRNVGLLNDFVAWLGGTGLTSPTIYLAIIVWVSVLLSSFIDNVPYTILMLPVCAGIAGTLGVSPYPLYFGMLVGTGIGGNLTPVGATANVLACGLLEKIGYRIRLREYMSVSVPITVVAVLVIYLLLQLIWMG
jgi:Na+/H+ antiporter NhaD/arsenite permease-like protein